MSFDVPAGTWGPRPRGAGGPVGRRIQQWMIKQHRKKWKFMGMDLLFLTTVGRKTGQEHTTPVAWFPYGDGSWVIVASAGGAIQHPGWYRNLAANPDRVRIELADGTIPVTPELLTGKERDEAWNHVTAAQPRFAGYERNTDRQFPVIHLIPKSPKAGQPE